MFAILDGDATCNLGRWRLGQDQCNDGTLPDVTSGPTEDDRELCDGLTGGWIQICRSKLEQPRGRDSG